MMTQVQLLISFRTYKTYFIPFCVSCSESTWSVSWH